jgi:hypothetical protein
MWDTLADGKTRVLYALASRETKIVIAKDLASGGHTVDFLQGYDVGIELFRVALERLEVEGRPLEFLRHIAGDRSLTGAGRGIAGDAAVGQFPKLFGGDEPLEVPGGDAQGLIGGRRGRAEQRGDHGDEGKH